MERRSSVPSVKPLPLQPVPGLHQFLANLNQLWETAATAGVGGPYCRREKRNDDDHEQPIEAGIRRDGSGQAARDRKQGREGEPRRRTPEQRRSVTRAGSSSATLEERRR